MFRAIYRFFRAVCYSLVGDLSKWSEGWEATPSFIRAQYDDIERDHLQSLDEMENALAELMGVLDEKEIDLAQTQEKIKKKTKQKAAAAAKCKQILSKHNGDATAAQQDTGYKEAASWFRDFSSSLAELQSEEDRLAKDVDTYNTKLDNLKHKMKKMVSEVDRIKAEKSETIADMVTSDKETRLNKMLSGIETSKHGEARQRMQDQRRKMRNKAKLSEEMAGIKNDRAEDQFMEWAEEHEADDELNSLLGIAAEAEAPESAPQQNETKLPEA